MASVHRAHTLAILIEMAAIDAAQVAGFVDRQRRRLGNLLRRGLGRGLWRGLVLRRLRRREILRGLRCRLNDRGR